MKICRHAGYRDVLAAATNDELYSSRQGLTNLPQRSSLLPRLRPRHLWPLLRSSALLAREAWSTARRNHGRFAELRTAEAAPYRRPIRAFLQERGSAGMEPIIRRHLEQVAGKTAVCLCRDLVWPCTEDATRDMLGIPSADWSDYREPMFRFMIGADPDPLLGVISRVRMRRRLELEVARQRRSPMEGSLIAFLLRHEIEGRRLSNLEIAGNAWMILGGYIGTEYFLSSALHFFGVDTAARREYLEHPEIRGSAVDELLRYFTPGAQSQRLITGECVAGGERYERGDVAILDWAAGNFDAGVFESPEKVDFRRSHRRHLSFGAGAHYCLGAGFARAFSELFLTRFLEAYPDYRIDASRSVMSRYPSLAGYETVPAVLGGVSAGGSAPGEAGA